MIGWTLDDRAVCAALMAAAGVLLALRPSPRAARTAWLVLLSAGMINAVALNLHAANPNNINYVHYYVGAKYPVPYGDFYKLVQAALGRPQLGVRDLDHPASTLRSDPHEQRAYYIDLLRADGAAFDPLAPLEPLARQAQESGAVGREADRILGRALPANRIEDFRRDVRAAVGGLTWQVLTADYGFNGSPFYAVVRHADPTLYRPFGRATAYLDLAWQMLATLLLAWWVGAALGLELHDRIAIAALVFASWDFVGFALPGLLFGEFWIPVAVAVWAMRRRRAVVAGAAIAWATLIKLFPLILLLRALARLVCPASPRAVAGSPSGARRWSLRLVGACALAAPALGFVSMLSGRSWADFLHKIATEFQAQSEMVNSVSLSAGLATLGVHDAPVTLALSLAALAFIVVMFLRDGDEAFMAALPRRSLVLIAAMAWLVHSWLNYYAVAPLLLLPFCAREHRAGAAVAAFGMAVAFVLPDFDDPLLLANPALHALKILPYLATPAWMVAVELRGLAPGRSARRAVFAVAAILFVMLVAGGWRAKAVERLAREARERLDAGDASGASDRYRRWLQLDPRSGPAHMNDGIALATMGNLAEAAAHFARAAELEPGNAAAQDNYARLLLMLGRTREAGERLEAARALTPSDPQILFVLARLRLGQGRRAEAVALLTRARELEPGDEPIAELLMRAKGS